MKIKLITITIITFISCNQTNKEKDSKNYIELKMQNKSNVDYQNLTLNKINTIYKVTFYKKFNNYVDSYTLTNYYLKKSNDTFKLEIEAGVVEGLRIFYNIIRDTILDIKSKKYIDIPTPFRNLNLDSGSLMISANRCSFSVFKNLGDTLKVIYFGKFKFEGHLPDSNYIYKRKK